MKLLVFTSLLLAASAQQNIPPELRHMMSQVHVMVEGLFTKADVNENGHFDEQDVASIFQDYDSNGDHQVSEDEFITRFTRNFPNETAMMTVVAKGLFIDVDMDKNHLLEQADFPLYFDKIDTDDNGQVNRNEFVDYFQQIFEVLLIFALKEQADLNSQHTTPDSIVG